MNCKECNTEFEGRANRNYCSPKCRNQFNTKKYRKDNNLHSGRVGRPEGKWLSIAEMSDENCIKFKENKNGN